MKHQDLLTSRRSQVVDQLAMLSSEKQALLALRLAQRGVRRTEVNAIPRRALHEHIPLSFTQERLWLLDQLEPNSALYNTTSALRLQGVFNLAAFRHALTEVVTRHETLRTTFPSVDGTPFQVIAEQPVIHMHVVDLRAWTASERANEALRLLTEESQRPFALDQGPLLRTAVIQLSPEEHLLSITIHHIISDGWSRSVLFRELAALYDAFVAGQPAVLPPLPIQYADFAVWQQQQFHSEQFAHHLTYWRDHLAGAPPLLALPTDRPRPTQQTYHGAVHAFTLPSSLTPALKILSQHEEATLFMTVLAAFQILLARYTDQDDIVVGSPIAGRTHVELEGLIGFFANTLVLRTDVSHNPTFREFLRRVRTTALNAYTHQDVPYEQLVAELHPQRHLSYSPLIQVLFALQNVPPSDFSISGVQSTRVNIDSQSAKLDLSLLLWDEEHGLRGEVEYNTDLFDEATIVRLVGHYQTLLEGIIANPDQPIAALPLLTAKEKHQLLVEWNTAQTPYPSELCVHHLFEAQVKQTPDAVAAAYEEQQLTYRELNTRANQLAHYLQQLGVGPDGLVALCMERSLDMIVGLLGILKVGAAYVPLNPSYPHERLAFILADTQAPVLLTQQHLLAALPTFAGARVCIDTDWEKIGQESNTNFESNATANTLAYVIYTSGSTGQPKGVEIPHRALTNFVTAAVARYALRPTDRVLQFASISFDAAVEEIFCCLIRGARLVLRTDSMMDSITTFLQRSHEWQISVWVLPTAYWHELTQEIANSRLQVPEHLRLVIIGGEAALPERLTQWRRAVRDSVRLLNSYGPTEATVYATVWEANQSRYKDHLPERFPIGHAIANVQTFVLDQQLHLVPIGIPGELCIGGIGLARGYLNRPELTAEKFIPHPFSQEPSARLYKTGDLVRYLPEGTLEFLGRNDNQVKIRGFRIELGEIEERLAQHPGVQQSVVLLREDRPGDKRLVAYVAPTATHKLSHSELQFFLGSRVPEYMIPSAFVFLDTLPFTPNGKIDRRALPLSESTRPELEQPFVAPRTPEEEVIAEVWREVLGLQSVGIHDNFFHLGGHSLLATQVIARINKRVPVEVSLQSMFQFQTIAKLATFIEEDQRQQGSNEPLDRLLSEIEALSEEEVKKRLTNEA